MAWRKNGLVCLVNHFEMEFAVCSIVDQDFKGSSIDPVLVEEFVAIGFQGEFFHVGLVTDFVNQTDNPIVELLEGGGSVGD